MSWWQTSVSVPAELAEAVAWILAERLDTPVEVQDTVTMTEASESGLSRVVVGSTTQPDDVFAANLRIALSTFSLQPIDLRTRKKEDSNWMQGWRAFFRPAPLTPRFAVRPPDEPALPEVTHTLTIEPGMAFGTGTHVTTRGALQLLDRVLGDRSDLRLLDVGTGSGILAIAAALLGHGVVAVEPDAVALENAAVNLGLNGVTDQVTLIEGSADSLTETFPVVVANIIAPILIELAPAISARCKGDLVLSGMMVHQEAAVRAAYAGLTLIERTAEGDWVFLHLRVPG